MDIKVLPRERAVAQIHEDIPDRFQIISPGLFDTQMCVHAGISSCSSQVLILFILDVLMRLRISVAFGETEIDDVHDMGFFPKAEEEILRFNISVNVILSMKAGNATKLFRL